MIYLGLGSNVGDGARQLARACDLLEGAGVKILHASSLYHSAALLPEGADASWDMLFTNQVIAVQTQQSPEQLLATLKQIEQTIGRQDRGHWGPREVDIDIIAYHNETLESDALHVPHAEYANRDFVLLPLQEIAPDFVCPRSMAPIATLVAALPNAQAKVA